MPFDTFDARMKDIALKTLTFCKQRYGSNGLRIEQGIDTSIGWSPTFHLKPTKYRLIAVEVSDNLFPEALKGAAHDISLYDFPIAVYQSCSLETYQRDPKQQKINQLKRSGFGIITVDSDGRATIQSKCIPLAQHISSEQLENELSALNAVLKVKFKEAHETYLTNEGQGLQEAGQIVEALVYSIAKQAVHKGKVPPSVIKNKLADTIDELYASTVFKHHRGALGGARNFVKGFRNTASHAPQSAKAAATKIKNCRKGFLEAIEIAGSLRTVMQAFGFKVKIYTT